MKIYNARARVLFFSLNLLFGDVLVAVAVLFCVRSQVISRCCFAEDGKEMYKDL